MPNVRTEELPVCSMPAMVLMGSPPYGPPSYHVAPQGFRGCGTLSIKKDAPFLFFSVVYMLFDILKPEKCNKETKLQMETPSEFLSWQKLDTPRDTPKSAGIPHSGTNPSAGFCERYQLRTVQSFWNKYPGQSTVAGSIHEQSILNQ